MLRKVLGLSVGTSVVRGLAAVSQLLLAFWLTPTEFGYWAAAQSGLALLSGLVNFGEVNAFLSGRGRNFLGTRRAILRMNLVLASLGLGVSALYFFSDRTQVAILVALSALSLPLVGDADLKYAAGVKVQQYRRVVIIQAGAAFAKVVVGVTLAWIAGSAIAFVAATVAFYVVLDIWLIRRSDLKRLNASEPDRTQAQNIDRFSWALNSWSMTLPIQSSFLAMQFVASPALVGTFYLAFQISLGITGLVAGPLARVALAELGRTTSEKRLPLATSLASAIAMLTTLAAAVFCVAALSIGPAVVNGVWSPVIVPCVLMVASLPVRMVGPVVDAYQQAENAWRSSTTFNLVDTVGTMVAALSAVFGDVAVVALLLSAWKICLALYRMLYVFRRAGRAFFGVVALLGLASCALLASPFLELSISIPMLLIVLTIFVLTVGLTYQRRRRITDGQPL